VLISHQISIGSPYLLNAFAAMFLGAAQFRQGWFNPWGTLLALGIIRAERRASL
jgi:ribose transport system permease protein